MLRRLVPWLGKSAIALTALLLVAGAAPAQQHNRRAGSASGQPRWSGGQPGYDNGSYSPYFGGYSGPRYYSGTYNPYYPQYYGTPYPPAAYGQDANGYAVPAPSYYSDDRRMATSAAQDDNAVRITVRVSPGAQIWFDGEKTAQTGSLRQFVSPAIDSEREFTYEIRAQWLEGGREVNRTRKVNFHAGDQLTVNFTTRRSPGAMLKDRDADVRPSWSRTEASEQPASLDRDPGFSPRQDKEAPALTAQPHSTHEGNVVRIGQNELVMTGRDDKEHSHALTAEVKMTCDGKECKCKDLKAGMRIRVTTKEDGKQTVTRIEALDRNDDFEKRAL